jgi:hypothetical protein
MFMPVSFLSPKGGEEHHPIWKLVTIVSAVVLFILVYCLLLWWKRGRNIKGLVLQLLSVG